MAGSRILTTCRPSRVVLLFVIIYSLLLIVLLKGYMHLQQLNHLACTSYKEEKAISKATTVSLGYPDATGSVLPGLHIENFAQYPCATNTTTQYVSGKVNCVRLFNETDMNPTDCHQISYKTLNGPTPLCIHDPERDYAISGALKVYGDWESHLVQNIELLLQNQPDLVFLDIGCNIGSYTIAAAKTGNWVVAVDPLLENLKLLSSSLSLGNLRDHVTLIWNALSNKNGKSTMNLLERTYGTAAIEKTIKANWKKAAYTVDTVRLDNLIPLFRGKRLVVKMDIEEMELRAFKGGLKFLDSVDVRLIQLEFAHHRNSHRGGDIIALLADKGFGAYMDINKTLALKTDHYSQWPHDVYFIKEHVVQ